MGSRAGRLGVRSFLMLQGGAGRQFEAGAGAQMRALRGFAKEKRRKGGAESGFGAYSKNWTNSILYILI